MYVCVFPFLYMKEKIRPLNNRIRSLKGLNGTCYVFNCITKGSVMSLGL